MMEEYTYKERRILRIYLWAMFAAGAIIILVMLGRVSHDLITSHEKSDPNTLLGIGVIGFAWIMAIWYAVVNSPTDLALTDRAMQVTWNNRKRKDYPWQDVTLRKTSTIVLILIRDSDWPLPRCVVLDGSSKQYKELIARIIQFKQLTSIDWL